MDSRSRSGFLGMQFDRLVEGCDQRSFTLQTAAGRFTLTRHENVVSCICELKDDSPENNEALHRRGAVDGVFIISPKLPGKEFGAWLDRLLTEDLGADPSSEVALLELAAAI